MVTSVSKPAENALGYSGWRVVLAAHFGVMLSFGASLVFPFSVFLKSRTAEFGWSREQVSGAFGVAALAVALASPLLGRLLDRRAPRPIVLFCFTMFGLAFASLSLLTPRLWHLYAVFLVFGIVGTGLRRWVFPARSPVGSRGGAGWRWPL